MTEIDPVKWLTTAASMHQQICEIEGHTPIGSYSLAEAQMCKKTLDTIEELEAGNKRLREALQSVKKDLLDRADKDGTVDVSDGVWIEINEALKEKDNELTG